MKAKNLISVLMVVLLLLPLVSADLIPTTAPCWYTGTVTGSNFTVEGLTVEAYKGSTLLKSGVITSGVYDLNSVGANDGDTIDLKVYGATFATSTFTGYCKTGANPWVVENFTVSKQANGAACNNGAICTSGTCSSNVCANPSSGGGGSGSSDKVNTTTSTTTTVTDTTTPPSTDTSSSNSNSGSTTNEVLIEVPGVNSIVERNDLVSEVTEALDINTIEVKSIEQESVKDLISEFTLNKEDTKSELNNVIFAQNVQDIVNAELDKYESVKVNVNTKVKVMKVTKKDGTEEKVTKIEREISINSNDIKGDTIRIIEVVPKEVALSAGKLSGNFIVLEDDPVLAFDVPLSSVVNGKVKFDYTVAGDVLGSNIGKIITSVVDKSTNFNNDVAPSTIIPTNTGTSSVPVVNSANEVNTSKINSKLIFSIIFVLIIIAIAAVVLLKKNRKQTATTQSVSDNYIARTYNYTSKDPNYRKIKDYIERYKHEYSKDLLIEALKNAKFSEDLIKKVLSEEYVLNKNKAYYMTATYSYSSKDPTYRKIKDYIEKYKYEYSKEQLVQALRKENFSEDLIKKVLSEEYK